METSLNLNGKKNGTTYMKPIKMEHIDCETNKDGYSRNQLMVHN